VLATDEQLLRWQHPRSDHELSFVGATASGELVGILGVIPVTVGVHGQRQGGAWLTTWLARPDARSSGVGLRLLELVFAEHDFVGTIGGNATTTRILGALRFHVLPSIPRWIRPVGRAGLETLLGDDARTVAISAVPSSHEFEARDWGADVAVRWDALWADRLAPTLVGTWRDARYVTRRYAEHPRFRYTIRVALDDGGAATALVVHRTEQVRGADAAVVRVVEALGEREPLASLLAGVVAGAHEQGAAFADFYCTTDRFAGALEAAGFATEAQLGTSFPSRFQPLDAGSRPLAAAFRLAGKEAGDPLAGADVYFTRSDCDQDRPA
jgi:hypothetical protein